LLKNTDEKVVKHLREILLIRTHSPTKKTETITRSTLFYMSLIKPITNKMKIAFTLFASFVVVVVGDAKVSGSAND